MEQGVGRDPKGSGSRASTEPVPVSALAGFDPSRGAGLFPINGFAPGGYMGTCSLCGVTMFDMDKRACSCLPCALNELKSYHQGVERALRIRLWNEARMQGQSDRASMQHIKDTLNAIAMEAREGRDGEARLDAKHDSAGL